MKKILIPLFIAFAITTTGSPAGPAEASPEQSDNTPNENNYSKNFIKFNITSALIKNYSLQYERVLSKNFTAALSFKIMPESGLPFTDKIISMADLNKPEEIEMIENSLVSNFTITPEVRFYMGKKKYGRGFYISLFYRYGRFNLDNVNATFESDLEEDVELNLSGDISSHTGGFMLGSQWALGKHLCLDWWILGPHFGISSGEMVGQSSAPLSADDQQNIEDELNDIELPMLKQTVNVTEDKATMKFDGPWAGLRTGFSIGFKF